MARVFSTNRSRGSGNGCRPRLALRFFVAGSIGVLMAGAVGAGPLNAIASTIPAPQHSEHGGDQHGGGDQGSSGQGGEDQGGGGHDGGDHGSGDHSGGDHGGGDHSGGDHPGGFGGGHVVLPLLEQEFVPTGWISEESFLAGYGATQAVPGPLFTFAAYLGTVMKGWQGGLVATFAVFLPAFLLISGCITFLGSFTKQS